MFNPCIYNTKKFSCIDFMLHRLKNNYYKKADKTRQDKIIANLIQTNTVKHHKSRHVVLIKQQKPGSEHAFSVTYFLLTENNRKVSVCKKLFLLATGIGQTKLRNIIHKVHSGDTVEERHGGDRKSYHSVAKKENVRDFIKKL